MNVRSILLPTFSLAGVLSFATAAPQAIRLVPVPEKSVQVELERSVDGDWTVRSTGPDPQIHFAPIGADADPDPKATVLAFEYFTGEPAAPLQVFWADPIPGRDSFSTMRSVEVSLLPKAELFQPFGIFLGADSNFKPAPGMRLRFDPGSQKGLEIRFRSFQLRPPTPAELRSVAEKAAERVAILARGQAVLDYLEADYPARITSVAIGPESVRIAGRMPPLRSGERYALMELPPHAAAWDRHLLLQPHHALAPEADGRFVLDRARYHHSGIDRLYARWMILRQSGDSWERASAAHWADDLSKAAEREGQYQHPASQKGLSGASTKPGIMGDLDEMGIDAVTVNFVLREDALLPEKPARSAVEHPYEGRGWKIDPASLASQDRNIRLNSEAGRSVSAVMLLPKEQSRRINHPGAVASSPYTMPNLDDPEANAAYRAILDFVMERYSRPDGEFGLVSNWIAHNEVDFAWQWTNMGETAMPVLMELYVRSMRLMALAAARWNPDAWVTASFTHYWDYQPQEPLRYYPPRAMLDLLLRFSEVEGNFRWGVAAHPYPEQLKSSDPWDDHKPEYAFDTPMITPKNIEVLDAYLRREDFLHEDKPRILLLSEQGFHTPDYSPESEALQSAALLYTFEKLRHLPTVVTYHYHRWVDHPLEGGLLCGLRRLPEDGKSYGPRKRAFEVFGDIGTEREDAHWPAALPLIGADSRDEIPYRSPIQ